MRDVLGMFEQAVLIAVESLGPRVDGMAVAGELRRRLRAGIFDGAVHATLQRLLEKRLVSSQREPGMRPGRPRQVYSLTAEGRRELERARQRVRRIWRGYARKAE